MCTAPSTLPAKSNENSTVNEVNISCSSQNHWVFPFEMTSSWGQEISMGVDDMQVSFNGNWVFQCIIPAIGHQKKWDCERGLASRISKIGLGKRTKRYETSDKFPSLRCRPWCSLKLCLFGCRSNLPFSLMSKSFRSQSASPHRPFLHERIAYDQLPPFHQYTGGLACAQDSSGTKHIPKFAGRNDRCISRFYLVAGCWFQVSAYPNALVSLITIQFLGCKTKK